MQSHKILTLLSLVIIVMMTVITNYSFAGNGTVSDDMTMPDTTLWLDIVINGKPTGQVLPVEYKAGHYWLTAEQLVKLGLPMLAAKSTDSIAIDNIDKVEATYNSELQQLLINIPSSWLPKQYLDLNARNQAIKARSSLGALMNYDFYVTSPEQKDAPDTFSLWTEQRVFDGFGVISNTGVYRKEFNSRQSNSANKGYIRYDSQWRYSDEESMTSYTFGDVITNSLPWSNSVRIGGFQMSRNFSIRPDLITYPLPQFAGMAAVPSTVDLYINSYKTGVSRPINPGPFTLETQPYINGAGNATIVTTDALGRQISTSVPFYVASNLLSAGLTDYSVSTGVMRRNYGIKSVDYSDAMAGGVVRHGYTDWLTLEGRAEGARHLFSGGIGADIRLATFGVLNLSLSGSQADKKARGKNYSIPKGRYDPASGLFIYDDPETFNVTNTKNKGHQESIGYSYNNEYFSVNAQRTIRSKGYMDLSGYKTSSFLSRRQDQVTGSIGLGRFGTLGAGYFEVRDTRNTQTRLVNLSWNTRVWRDISFYASMNREIGSKGYSAQLMLVVPFGDTGNATLSSSRDTDNHWVTRTTLSQTVPSDGGFGWDAAFANGGRKEDKYRQLGAKWRSDYFEVQGGMYGYKDNYNRWGEMTGSLVFMDNNLYATNKIYDAFALVSTNGFADIPVSYENQLIGKTNSKGYMLIPDVTSWNKTRLEINTLALPADVESKETIQDLSVREGSGLLINFDVHAVKAVSFVVVDGDGKIIPKGSVIILADGQKSWVGLDGAVWLEHLKEINHITIIRADNGKQCLFDLRLDKNDKGIIYLDKQICR